MTVLARKLANFSPVNDKDRRAIEDLFTVEKRYEAGSDIVTEGSVPPAVFTIAEGMACRYRLLADGRRQIMSFLLPGDLCDLHVFVLKAMDHSIAALAPTRIASAARDRIIDLLVYHPRVSAGLWWNEMQEHAILRERIVGLGRLDAAGRVAYLLCELYWRFQAIGMVRDHRFVLPLTQPDLADALGLTPVHVNRILQRLRQQELVEVGRRSVTIQDLERLQEVALFSNRYLHLGGAPEEIRSYFDQLEAERQRLERNGT